MDWSKRGRARVFLLTALGTALCIGVAFAFDSYSLETGEWRWGTEPLNNVLIPLLLAAPFFYLLLSKMRELAIAHHELMTVAATDELTSLLNRRAFTEMVDRYLDRLDATSEKSEGGLLIVDVDHFKAINDNYGHPVGDQALKLIAQSLRNSVRETDLVGRLGGEEFGIFLPGRRHEHVAGIAERICGNIGLVEFAPGGAPHAISVSVGGVTFDNESKTAFSNLFVIADACLYEAKRAGRDRFELVASNGGKESRLRGRPRSQAA